MINPVTICGKCGSQSVEVHPVLHHFLCAYVGPEYDFAKTQNGFLCPKCRRVLADNNADWEILGDCSFCKFCSDEKML